ncbi:MAG TPA: ATP-binding protein [Chloroflexota bacterium]|nr:ATP-binding protein [Chloroflexota bacterium]
MSIPATDPTEDNPIAALRMRRNEILARWIAETCAQPFHQHDLEHAVTDHMPRLLDALLASLDGTVSAADLGQGAALDHAAVRAAQGLSSSDMVIEFRLLRNELQQCLGTAATISVDALLDVEARVHDELDTLVIAGLRAFDSLARARAGGLNAMGRVAHEISALRPLEETLYQICDRARELLRADQATIALPEPDGALVFRASSGNILVSVLDRRLAPGEGSTGRAFALGEMVVANAQEDAEPGLLGPAERVGGIHALLVAPLRRGGSVVGTLSVGSIQPRIWAQDERDLLEMLAAQAAIALDNARLYETLGRREHLLDQIIRSAPALIAVIAGLDNRYELANPPYRAIAPEQELIGRPVRSVHDARLTALIEAALEHVRQGEPAWLENVPIQLPGADSPSPTTHHFTFSYLPLAASASDDGVLVVGYETTEAVAQRTHIETLAALAATRADTLAAVIGAMPDGVYVCDINQLLVMINRSGAELLGLSVEATLKPLAESITSHLRLPGGRPLPLEEYPLARAVRGEVRTNQEILIQRADSGEDRLLRVSLAPIRDAAGTITGGVCVAHDVTILRRLEQERDEFVSRASHELKTPLTSATGLLQLARRRLARQEEDPLGLGPMLETAQKQVDRLAVLVDDLRSVSQLRAGQLRLHRSDLDLRNLLEESARSLHATTEHHVLRLQQAPDALPIHGDATRLAQVLDNLISNAIKYSPDGGEVWLRSTREDGRAVVEIQDRGIGIPAQDRGTLFEPFHRASNADQASTGMGLGLYISRELARQHGGDLLLARTSAEGTTFRLVLPLIEAAPADAGQEQA